MKNPNFLNQLSGLLQRIRPRPHKLTVPLFTVALGLSVTLYACQSSAQKEITLCFAVPDGEIEDWEHLTKKFNHDNEGKIKIELNQKSTTEKLTPEQLKYNYSNSLKRSEKTKNTNCNGKDGHYDLVYTDIIWLPEFAHKKYLLPLDDYFKEEEQYFLNTEIEHGKYPPKNNSNQTSPKLYRIPFRTDVGVLYYNKRLLGIGKEKVPTTPENLIETVGTLNLEKHHYGYLWQANEEGLVAMFVEVLHAHGGFWVDNGKAGLGEPKAIKAVKFLKQTMADKISRSDFQDEQEAIKSFKESNAVFLRNWPAAWAEFQDIKDRVGIAPVPGGKGCHGGWGLAIAKNIGKKRQEAAIKAVKFLTSRESQLLFTLSHGSVPTREDLFFDPLIVSRYSHYPKLFNMVKLHKRVSRPRLARYEKVSKILQKSLQKAFDTKTKDDDVEGIMKKASEDTEKCLKDEKKCTV